MFDNVKDIQRKDDEQIAHELVSFHSFAMHDSTIRDSDNYAIVYTHNRGSDLLTQANTFEIDKLLAEYLDVELSEDAPMLQTVSMSHWLCGWIAGYAVAVYMADGTVTPAFSAMCDIARRLDNYPCLNEDKWSELESESEYEWYGDLAHDCERDSDYEIPFTADLIDQAIRDNDIRCGYGYYGELHITGDDLELVAFYASLETYRDMNCSD